jgi:hypothetical protein
MTFPQNEAKDQIVAKLVDTREKVSKKEEEKRYELFDASRQ